MHVLKFRGNPRKQDCYPWDSGQWGNQLTRRNCAGYRNPPVPSDAKREFKRNSSSLWHRTEPLDCTIWNAASFPLTCLSWNIYLVQKNLNHYKMYCYGINSNILLKKRWERRKMYWWMKSYLVDPLHLSPLVLLLCIQLNTLNCGAWFFVCVFH